MKKLNILFCFLIICFLLKAQQIVFYNIGLHDKPLTTLIIDKHKHPIISVSFLEYLTVEENTYSLIEKYVYDHNSHINNKDEFTKEYQFGSYSITIFSNLNNTLFDINTDKINNRRYMFKLINQYGNISYILDNNIASVNYFKNLVKLLRLKKQNKIADKFSNLILKRIDFVEYK